MKCEVYIVGLILVKLTQKTLLPMQWAKNYELLSLDRTAIGAIYRLLPAPQLEDGVLWAWHSVLQVHQVVRPTHGCQVPRTPAGLPRQQQNNRSGFIIY